MSAQTHVSAWQIGEWVVNPKDDSLTRDSLILRPLYSRCHCEH
jgi:hypothetical protein